MCSIFSSFCHHALIKIILSLIQKNYHSYKNCIFLIYEELTNPNYIKTFLEKINLDQVENLNLNYFKNSNKKIKDINFDSIVYENALNVYKKFKMVKPGEKIFRVKNTKIIKDK